MSKLKYLAPLNPQKVHWNLCPEELVEHSIKAEQGVLSDQGALCILTGRFTGRSPDDRFIVKDEMTESRVDWGKINHPISTETYEVLEREILEYFSGEEVYVQDAFACADKNYRLSVRLIAERPWSAQFATNMFIRPNTTELEHFSPDWNVLCAPGFEADPEVHGTKSKNFAIINFTRQRIIIGGTGYTGEIKKGIFSVLNFILPIEKNVLPMHCSANIGERGDTSVFFGLSGTGKTTLSADSNRMLIGDDEHGWSHHGVFNFEGGCYAKCIDLSEEKEPEIFGAIRHGAILENIIFRDGTRIPDYSDDSITQNTRVSYPIFHIDNIAPHSIGDHPQNIFFLTADAFGVLPPISKLTKGQAMYHFISGYTAKVAGTEDGIEEPTATFSSGFGAPFLPLHPTVYAQMLGKKIEQHEVRVWLVNTGWTGGAYGTGSRINLAYTRAMIRAAMAGQLDDVEYQSHQIFGLSMPTSCPNVPGDLLNPRNTWKDTAHYDQKADFLAQLFIDNFAKFEDKAGEEILKAAPHRLNLLV